MSAKSNRNKKNQAAESRLVDHSEIEQRALQIARNDGRDLVTADDRAAAREELLAPNDNPGDPEVAPELGGGNVTAWDEAPGSSGRRVARLEPEDEAAIGKELAERGMRGPHGLRKTSSIPPEKRDRPLS